MKQIYEIIAQLDGPHADKIFVGKDYTKADLIHDLRALIPPIALVLTESAHVPGGVTWVDWPR